MREIAPYLIFDGTCAEAMRFYEKTLGGKLETIMTYGESPMAKRTPPEQANQVMHSRLAFGSGVIMAADGPSPDGREGMAGFSISLFYDTPAEGKRVFDALAQGGKVNMPYQETFWAKGFGMLVDRFGTPWFVSGGSASA